MDIFRPNQLKKKVSNGEIALGIQLRSASERVAELIGMSGFDFVYIEAEHFLCDDRTLENILRAADAWNCTPIVRLSEGGAGRISQLYSAGAGGVILPHVETGEEARAFVQAAKFPPMGNRSATTCRCGGYGLLSGSEVCRWGNEETLAIAMIETCEGIQNLDEILDAGIDMIRIGFQDLAQDVGHPGEPRHSKVLELVRQAIETAAKHGVAVGGAASTREELLQLSQMGFTHFTVGSDLAILSRQFVKIQEEQNDGKETSHERKIYDLWRPVHVD